MNRSATDRVMGLIQSGVSRKDIVKVVKEELKEREITKEEKQLTIDLLNAVLRTVKVEKNNTSNISFISLQDEVIDKEMKQLSEYLFCFAQEFKKQQETRSSRRQKSEDSGWSVQDRILKSMAKGNINIEQLSKSLKISPLAVELAIDDLIFNNIIVEVNGGYKLFKEIIPNNKKKIILPYSENNFRFGAIGDTHGGSVEEQVTNLNLFYDICEAEGIKHVFHTGDMTAGVNMYRSQKYEAPQYGADRQSEWVIKNFPKRKNIKNFVIAGNHDGSFFDSVGYDIVKRICSDREDMEYLGYCNGEVQLENGLKIELLHPDGGVPYALSYRTQKYNISKGREVDEIPHIILYGHCHVSACVAYRGLWDIMCGCFEGKTTYETRKSLKPDIGGWIFDVNLKDGAINKLRPIWIPFKEIKRDWKSYQD